MELKFIIVNQINKASIKLGSIFMFIVRVWFDWLRGIEIAVCWALRILVRIGKVGRHNRSIGKKAAPQ